jgi:hypothetical protein
VPGVADNQLHEGSIMNVKTNLKVGGSIKPRPEPLH